MVQQDKIQTWLRRRIASERRNALGFAILGSLSGTALTGLSSALGTGTIYLAIHQIMEIGHIFWDWQSSFEPTPFNLGFIAIAFLALQAGGLRRSNEDYIFHLPQVDWRSNENIGTLIAAIWAILLDIVYSGPRLIYFSRERLRLRRELLQLNQTLCAVVLRVIHQRGGRVSFTELARNIPGFTEEEHLAQLLLIPGVMHLPSDPPGLSVTGKLLKEFGPPIKHRRAQDASGAANAPKDGQSEKPPSFRCTACRRKFRLRNLRGGVTFNCPRCGEAYHTVANSQDRVRVELGDDEYGPAVDMDFGREASENYLILGLNPGAGKDEVKKAYRKKMKEFHPDKAANLNPQYQNHFEERSKEINRAYGAILDELK